MSKKRRSCYAPVREAAGAHKSCPVVLEPGNGPPRLAGHGFCWRTKSGDYIRHPSAYSKVGRSNMVYHGSTLRVEVGLDWLAAHAPEVIAHIVIERLGG
jgi:hypothetical protein